MIRPLLRRFLGHNMTPSSLTALRDAYAREWERQWLWDASLNSASAVYPFLTQPSWLFETDDLDNLVKLSDRSVEHLPVDPFFMLLVRSMLNVWNGNHYFLTHFDRTNDEPHLFAAPGKFFQYISECKKKEHAAAKMKPGDPLPSIWPTPPTDDLMTAKADAAGIGCGVTIVGPRNDDGSRSVVLQQRSGATIGHVGSWSVAPTFVFQPFDDQSHEDNLALSAHVYRETAEEFYGVPEPDTSSAPTDEPEIIRRIRESVESRTSRMRCVGFGLDGCNLEPNIGLLLEVNDGPLFAEMTAAIEGSWENSAIGVYSTKSDFLREKLLGYYFTCGSAFCLTRALAVL